MNRNWGRNLMQKQRQRPWRNAAYFLVLHGLLRLLSPALGWSKLGPPTSTTSKKMLHRLTYRSDRGNSSGEVPSSQKIASVKTIPQNKTTNQSKLPGWVTRPANLRQDEHADSTSGEWYLPGLSQSVILSGLAAKLPRLLGTWASLNCALLPGFCYCPALTAPGPGLRRVLASAMPCSHSPCHLHGQSLDFHVLS